MSFQPIVQILQVPRSSDSFYFKDATPVYPDNPTGWGAPNAPADVAAITSVHGAAQPYGKEPVKSTEVSGNLATKADLQVYIADGAINFWVFYGQQRSAAWTVSADRKTLTFDVGVDLTALLDSVEWLSPDGEYPVHIKSKAGQVVILDEALPGILTEGIGIYRYWLDKERRLVQNCLEGNIVNAISVLPLKKKNCDSSQDILDTILLKLAAETAFNCGNFSRAQEASDLGCQNQTIGSTNCSSCG